MGVLLGLSVSALAACSVYAKSKRPGSEASARSFWYERESTKPDAAYAPNAIRQVTEVTAHIGARLRPERRHIFTTNGMTWVVSLYFSQPREGLF